MTGMTSRSSTPSTGSARRDQIMGSTAAERQPAKITVHVQPNAGRSAVIGFRDGVLRVRVAAPPEKGKANRELVALLSDALGVTRSNVIIERGAVARKKTVAITGLSQEQAVRLLQGSQGAPPISSGTPYSGPATVP